MSNIISPANIRSYWLEAGGDPAKADLATAVAMAESHGDADATHQNKDGSIDRGLWQINSVHGAQSTTNPYANAQAAVSISKNGTDWSPWVTFNNGAYKQFLGKTQGTSTGTVVQDAASTALDATGITGILNSIPWFRIGKGALGFTLIVIGAGTLVAVVANKTPAPVKQAAALAAL